MSRGKILVIRGGAIGDFVLTLPVLSALRRQFPETHLEVLGYPHIANLSLAGGLVDQVRSIEARPLANFFARGGNLSEELRDYFSSFAIIVSFLYDPDHIFQTNVATCSKAQFIAGPHRPNEREKLHATKTFLRPLERLAIFDAEATPRLNLATPHSSPDTFLALHPGSGSEQKNWPQEQWAALIDRLVRETNLPLLLVGGEAEGTRLRELSRGLPEGRVNLAEKLPLVELAARLKTCRAFVGHDSGISHLAAALDCPALVLWGNTVEEIWRPLNPRAKLIRDPQGLMRLPLETVFAELENLLVENR